MEKLQHVEFLQALFKGSEEYIEIKNRTTKKSKYLTIKKTKYQSLNGNNVEDYIPKQDETIYFGVFGRTKHKGEGPSCRDNCGTTGALWADYDHMSVKEAQDKIKAAGLPEASIMVHSGNGCHAYWLLEQRAEEEALPIVKAIARATGGDLGAAKVTQPMRLPGSMNVKDLSNPKPCSILHSNGKWYSLDTFTKILKVEEAVIQQIDPCTDCNKNCVHAALSGVETGFRSWGMGIIISWHKAQGKGRSEVFAIAQQANERNKPQLDKAEFIRTFNTIWDGSYYFGACRYEKPESQKKQDRFCSAGSCHYHGRHSGGDCIAEDASLFTLDNMVFKPKVYPKLSGDGLAIYLTLLRIGEAVNIKQLADALQRHEKADSLRKSIHELMKFNCKGFKLIEVKRRGKSIMLRAIPTAEYNYNRGYTVISASFPELYLGRRITETELKFMLLLKHNSFKKNVFTLDAMAEMIGVDSRTLWRAADKLEKIVYIKRSTFQKGNKNITIFKLLL